MRKIKVKNKSVFRKELESSFAVKKDKELSTEERKEARYKKLDKIFESIGNKKNRYLFYCPDIPFANSMVKVIYEYVHLLNSAGYNAQVLHEQTGFKPNWLKYDWIKDIEIGYLSDKKKQGGYSTPTWDFKPTDTVIIPDGFWEVMKSLYQITSLHKVVLCFGYSGLSTIDPGISWSLVGITDVICVSEQVRDDYKQLWPEMNYHVVGYEINFDKLEPIEPTEVKPIIGLMARSREDAQQIINIFFTKYPFLDLFQFKIMKKLNTDQYFEILRECAALVFIDEKAGYPAPPIEALAADVTVIAPYGRGMSHILKEKNIIWTSSNDNFLIVEELAGFCLDWLEKIPETNKKNNTLLNKFKQKEVLKNLLTTMDSLQEYKVKFFTAVKKAAEEGKLDDSQLDLN